MGEQYVDACVSVDISDDDVYDAMRDISGYLDITPGDFKELYVRAYQHAVTRLTSSVKARDIMTREVAVVTESTPLGNVAELMAEREISGVPVVDAKRNVVGVISEKDFLESMGADKSSSFMHLIAICLSGKGCLAVPSRAKVAADIMTQPGVTVPEDIPIMEIAHIMTTKHINRVPVVDNQGRIVGIVSRADVVRSSFVKEAT